MSIFQITIELLIAIANSVYILFLSISSPCPPFMDHWIGSTLSVLSWIFSSAIFMRSRCLIAARLERFGQTTLVIFGVLTMVGQIFGGLLVYVTVNIYDLFKSKPDCVTSNSHCVL